MAYTIILMASNSEDLFEWFHYDNENTLQAFGADHLHRYRIDKAHWVKIEPSQLQDLSEYGGLMRIGSDFTYYRIDGDLVFSLDGAHRSDNE